MDEELHKKLLKKAGSLLARRSYSRGELRIRLSKLAEEHHVEAILDRLEQLNLLNDAEYAYNFAFCRVRQQGWGSAKVRDSLLRRHVAQDTVDSAIDRVRVEASEDDVLADYLQRYCRKAGPPADMASVRKLVVRLRRRGFEEDLIYRGLKGMVPATLLQQLTTGE
jgi:regulatory protein